MHPSLLQASEMFIETSKRIILEGRQSPPIVVFFYAVPGDPPFAYDLAQLDLPDDEEKARIFRGIQYVARSRGAAAVLFVGEAWMAAESAADRRPPRRRSDRQEGIVCALFTPTARRVLGVPILRRETGVRFGKAVMAPVVETSLDPWERFRSPLP